MTGFIVKHQKELSSLLALFITLLAVEVVHQLGWINKMDFLLVIILYRVMVLKRSV